MDALLAIGQFSDRSGLSPKMLRTYAAAGLLTPAAVDRHTGYRYYTPAQVQDAQLIGILRKAGIPLVEIGAFLRDRVPATLERWERDLDDEVRRRRAALAEARRQLGARPAAVVRARDQGPQPGGERVTTLNAAAATDIGRVRSVNQDAVLVDTTVWAVADGMGRGGEIASTIAVDTLREVFAADRTPQGMLAACRAANHAVWERSEREADLADMGTTMAAVGLLAGGPGPGLAAVHVGDSRAYVFSGGRLLPVTRDHSVVADMVRAGELTEEEARTHEHRSILTRALGIGPEVDADVADVPCGPGDRILLCTDGLFTEVDDGSIAGVLASTPEPAGAARELVRLAVAAGGRDNASVVVIAVG